ncbi:MAG: hypothetical protein ACON43_02535 [Flavobacteriaceae bacterium]
MDNVNINLGAQLEQLQDTIQHLIELQNQRLQDPNQAVLPFLDWLTIEQCVLWTGIKTKSHLRKLMGLCGVETRSIQGLAQGPGMKLRYSRKDIDKKIIVMLHEYRKIDLKNSN